jgi:hypothetical protein
MEDKSKSFQARIQTSLDQDKRKVNDLRIPQGGVNYKPIWSAIPAMASMDSAANSSIEMPNFSHSIIFSRFTEAANAFSFIRFTTDFGLTEATFRSGYT